jgi:uncharacterized integral membrane protein (TIGR00697 family)
MELRFQQNIPNRPYKCIIFLSMFYFCCFIGSAILSNRLISIHEIVGSAATLIFPFTYFCSDAIAEVYGYKVARQLIWSGLACELIFALLMTLLIKLPFPENWHYNVDYDVVLGPLPRIFIASFVAMTLGSFLNIYFLTKWKVKLRGRFFWLRSLISSTIGELIFTVLADLIIFYDKIPMHDLLQIMVTSYLFKVLFAPAALIPAIIIVIILRKIEGIDIFDYHTNFNPFKLSIND